MRTHHLTTAFLLGLLTVACDRSPTDPKPGTPPPNPNPLPSAPQASASKSAGSASQPVIVPSAATQQRGPEAPAVGSVAQPPRRAGGDANPVVTTPGGTGVGVGSPATR